jgi:hypothetical protein
MKRTTLCATSHVATRFRFSRLNDVSLAISGGTIERQICLEDSKRVIGHQGPNQAVKPASLDNKPKICMVS